MFLKIKPVTAGLSETKKKTILFAARELQKYLRCVLPGEFPVLPVEAYANDGGIYLGVSLCELPKVEDPEKDDAIHIRVKDFSGVITGTNPRAVLIAVYRFLTEKGFRFLRPGNGGEVYPKTIDAGLVEIIEAASYRHRAVCIEGSVFQEEILEMIDWLPKASMNGYFIQFKLPKAFFERWYTTNNPYRDTKPLTDEEIRGIVSLMEEEITLRGLLYHGVGHGWTSSAIGLDGSSWSVYEGDLTEEQSQVVAQINGERKLWDKTPLNTNLCYSNPEVRSRITDDILQYCKSHPQIDYLHFWLADFYNNYCECDECKKLRQSEYYVMMLNELDEKLTREGLQTKIVFLIYFDLLWKPVFEKICNHDRFVLMFAPITRSYSESFPISEEAAKRKPYVLNQLEFPKNVSENISYLKDWQADFPGDSFDFDYHYMWDHYYDFSYYGHSYILHEDIRNLKDLSLNGFVSCQLQRVFLPTSLGMNMMAKTLWNRDTSFDEACCDVLSHEFGGIWQKVLSYLKRLSGCNCAKVLRGEEKMNETMHLPQLQKARALLDEMEPVLAAYAGENALQDSCCDGLLFHLQLYRMLLDFYWEFGMNKNAEKLAQIKDFVWKNENKFRDVFDATFFLTTLEGSMFKRLEGESVVLV